MQRVLHILSSLCLCSYLLLAGGPALALDLLDSVKGLIPREEGGVLWSDHQQFVKLISQDGMQNNQPTPENSHPTRINTDDLARVMASLHTSAPKKTPAYGNIVRVFSDQEITVLAARLADALARANRNQDVVFAVTGVHDDLGTAYPRSTAGRLFMLDGKLNLIFGDQLAVASDEEKFSTSHYSRPHRAGRRSMSIARHTRIAPGPGITFAPGKAFSREDWIQVDIPVVVAAYKGPRIPTDPTAAAVPAPAAGGGGLSPERQETMRLREELARMRKELEASRNVQPTVPASTSVPATPPAPAAATAVTTQEQSFATIEQRLSALKSLYDRQLITKEEYDSKRKEIITEF